MKQVKRTTLTRNMQRVLNRFGFTDDGGNTLKEDGVYGDKTKRAVKKFSKYQEELRKPSYATKKWQEGLNNAGYRDSEGKTLKTDGVHGSKTDAATAQFENDFLGTLDKTYQPKTVQKKVFPFAPEYDFGELVGALKQENGADKILGGETKPKQRTLEEFYTDLFAKQSKEASKKNMVYNMNNSNGEEEEGKKLSGTPALKPTQPPQGTIKENGSDWSKPWNAAPQYGTFDTSRQNNGTGYEDQVEKLGLEDINETIDKELAGSKRRVQDGIIQVDVNGNWVDCRNVGDAQWMKICGAKTGRSMTQNGGAIVSGGQEYPINAPIKQGHGEQMSATWETVDRYTTQNISFDPAKGIAKMELEGLDHDSMQEGSTSLPQSSGAAAALELAMNAMQLGLDSISTADYTVSLQKQNPGTPQEASRAVVNVSTSGDRRSKMGLEAGKEYSLVNGVGERGIGTNNPTGRANAENTAKDAFQQYTGKEPDPFKTYDIVTVYDEGYIKSPYQGTLSKDEKGNTVYVPNLNGVSMYIVERGAFGWESRRIPLVKNIDGR